MSDMETEILSHDFYTMERWNNWITQVKESGFEFKESEEPQDKDSAVFINMEDDIILACLKVVAKFEKNLISAESAFHLIAQIKEIALAEIEPISDDIDMMIASIKHH
jgi:hypothetical protein